MQEFDSKAATWDENSERIRRANEIANAINSELDLSQIRTALEYGCGTGLLSFALKDGIDEVTLMDESALMIQEVDRKCEQAGIIHFHPVKYNLLEDELPHFKVDLIYSLMTLHHIDDVESILESFQSLLNPSGYLVLIDLVTEDGSFHNHKFDGHLGFDRDELEYQMKEAGFTPIQYSVCYTIKKERAGEIKEYPLFMLIGRK
ncbi:class I SAM-dependent methyltransferase [bacterium SCSIO 12643]|nr:class I SAM-dependent methyltransferase [bacterium SCSIO 12643]